MIKWTTPTLKCTIPNDLTFEYLIITFLQNTNKIIEKRVNYNDVVDGVFEITLSQKETGKFQKNVAIEVQLNIIQGDTRMATNIVQLVIIRNLHDEEI